MKNLFLLLIAGLAAGCSATNIVSMTVTEPAPVELPSYLKRVGTVNRSMTSSKGGKTMDDIDKVLSAEGKNLDKDGAAECMAGLSDQLQQNSRFEAVISIKEEPLDNPNFGVFPSPMAWDKLATICASNKLDGLFVLEFYDTDSKVNYAMNNVTVKGPLGFDIPAIEHVVTVNTIIKTGWRIYDNTGKNIIDEFVVTEGITSTGRGINPAKAAAAIMGRKQAVNNISRSIGQSYANSIVPYRIRVKRDYYVKGSDNFKAAKRKAQTGNWDGAAELWQSETKNPKAKVAGRAHYNMAIINEINGELDEAINWAKLAYENFNDKIALRYVKILNNRKAKNQILERQQQQ